MDTVINLDPILNNEIVNTNVVNYSGINTRKEKTIGLVNQILSCWRKEQLQHTQEYNELLFLPTVESCAEEIEQARKDFRYKTSIRTHEQFKEKVMEILAPAHTVWLHWCYAATRDNVRDQRRKELVTSYPTLSTRLQSVDFDMLYELNTGNKWLNIPILDLSDDSLERVILQVYSSTTEEIERFTIDLLKCESSESRKVLDCVRQSSTITNSLSKERLLLLEKLLDKLENS